MWIYSTVPCWLAQGAALGFRGNDGRFEMPSIAYDATSGLPVPFFYVCFNE